VKFVCLVFAFVSLLLGQAEEAEKESQNRPE
jgi:hypothetical protein